MDDDNSEPNVFNFDENMLPPEFENKITESTDSAITIRANLKNMEDIIKWMDAYMVASKTHWIHRHSNPNGTNFICMKKYVCQHSKHQKCTNPIEFKKTKNADCKATITIKIKLNTVCTRRKDPYVKLGLCGVIIIDKIHSHSLLTAEALSFLPANKDLKDKFFQYFDSGLGIADSCAYHEKLLELDDNYDETELASGNLNPIYRTVRYWHDQWRLLNLGPRNGVGLLEKLKEKQDVYLDQGITVVFKEEPFAVVIITPLMKRTHFVASAQNIVFVDTTSACDPESHSITFLLTTCSAGASPLGVIITKGQSYQAYYSGFKLFSDTISNGFNGQGYPDIFMTDQSQAEINALRAVWPKSQSFLCIFHVCQSVWRWLWDSKNSIKKEDRPSLIEKFQSILYSLDPVKALAAFDDAVKSTSDYPNFQKYLLDYWNKKESWCLAWRDEKFRGHNTNNFSEVTVRIFKDVVLSRVKAYNVIALVDFACTVLEEYYVHRFRKFANSRNSNARTYLLSLNRKAIYLNPQDIISNGDEFLVPSSVKEEMYVVNAKIGVCSCPSGHLGKFCKHQYAIFKFFDICPQNFPPIKPEDKHAVAYLALGNKVPPLDFYKGLILTDNDNFPSATIDVQTECTNPAEQPTECTNPAEQPTECTNPADAICPVTQNATENYSESTDDNFDEIWDIMKGCHNKYGTPASGIKSLKERLLKINSVGQWETFVYCGGNRIPLRKRDGSAIHVQPTALSRRSASITRGSKRMPSGRPSGVSKKKRKRNLADNIRANVPNAKSH